MNQESVATWLVAYSDAWKTYDPDAIGRLFSEDARYRYQPWANPIAGRAAIIADWVATDHRDAPGTYTSHYEPLVVAGSNAVATGRSRYFAADGTTIIREYYNSFVLIFNDAGECTDFTEWFMQTPENLLSASS